MEQYPQADQAFGIDPSRSRFYSLRQSRYDALAQDVSDWAGLAAAEGQKLLVLDVGCGWGVLLRHLQFKPHFAYLIVSATELEEACIYLRESYHEIFLGNLMDGYPQIGSGIYDVVVCEQVLEHLPEIDFAITTLVRVLKPKGKLIIGVPVFFPPLHWLRKYIVPYLCHLTGLRRLGAHQQAFSIYSLLRQIRRHPSLRVVEVRGFRVISGGLLGPLENYRWWWRLNRRIGKLIPAICIEIQVIIQKDDGSGPSQRPISPTRRATDQARGEEGDRGLEELAAFAPADALVGCALVG
jgi:SAM-dependent methyltransferase